jgi:hypothetical protein
MSTFTDILASIAAIHELKREDYTGDRGEYFNFEEAASQAGILPAQAIETLIGVKQARLMVLRSGDKEPNNESISDTLLDRAVYCIIALAHYYDENNTEVAARESDASLADLRARLTADDRNADFNHRKSNHVL